MANEFSVAGKRVVVVGAARSGIAAAELLVRREARVTLTESRPTFDAAGRLRDRGVALELGGHDELTLAGADLIVVSPGVPTEQSLFDKARARGVEIIGELELASRWLRGRVIAITGTKGKSTTTTLVGRMLTAGGRRVLVGGNIGVPVSSQVDASTPDTVHVVEVSSFQLETTTTFKPWIALWVNFADDHLDRHPDVATYAAAKARVFANQSADDWAVVNADDPIVMAKSRETRARVVTFAPSGHVDEGFVAAGDWIVRRTTTGEQRMVPVSAVELTGAHMLHNVIAAVAVSAVAGVEPAAMTEALSGFHGLPHVMEPVGAIGGVRFVNDSKATNVEAARRSIESFSRGVVAIVGGRYKGGDFGELHEPLRRHGRAVIAIGEAAPRVREALEGTLPVIDAASMEEAVARGFEAAKPDGVVVLAPACSSFDWFTDYAARGEAFKAAVKELRARV
ncbi:MAG TPA: UDP-N-acetylmuramoyl-L-alanine--D-glutamate ligase [Vicinamibacterales bacterium]|nr:UDP-N-acetylmuramoyl-L-alanine--D-glutamate ligase [Vicinamibacterales bacterium]